MNNLPQTSDIYECIFESRQQRYTLAVPDRYTNSNPVPLVIALHWGGPITPFFGKPFLVEFIEPALRDLGALIVAPDCQHGKWHNPESEAEIMALLQTLQANHRIDVDKIILTGYSMGGIGTWYLAARNQNLFAAAIPMAAPPPPGSSKVAWQTPLYVIHSRGDEHFPLGPTAAVAKALQDQGHDVTFVVLDDVTHYDAGGFVGPLRAIVPWLKQIWSNSYR